MNELSAWNRFCETGKITDYLTYKEAKASTGTDKGGENGNEAEYGRTRTGGEDFGRQQTTFNNSYS